MLLSLVAVLTTAALVVVVRSRRKEADCNKTVSRILIGASIVSMGVALWSILALPALTGFMAIVSTHFWKGIAFQVFLSILTDAYCAYVGVYEEWTSFVSLVLSETSVLSRGKGMSLATTILVVLSFLKSAFDSWRSERWKSQSLA